MTRRQTLLGRLLPLITPALQRDFAPPPVELDTGLWALDRRYQMPGGPVLPSRSTIIRLADGGLVVISPPPVEAGGLEHLDALGVVRHVVVPNAFHHLNASGFLACYPNASFSVAPGLFARVPGLPKGSELTETAPEAWRSTIDQAVLAPTSEVSEVAFFHRRTATLVLTDVAFHLVRFERGFDRIAWRLSGVPSGFGPSRTSRTMLLRDKARAQTFLERLLTWPFRRIIVAHGETLEVDAAAEFTRAFAAYLPRRPAAT